MAEIKFYERLSDKSRLVISVRLPDLQQRYFSVTAEQTGYRRRSPMKFGMLHELILEARPELSDVVRLHLSDADGVPMYATEDGWYWLESALGWRASSGMNYRRILSENLRLSAATVEDMINNTYIIGTQETREAARKYFVQWVEDLKPRWKAEADAAVSKYSSLA